VKIGRISGHVGPDRRPSGRRPTLSRPALRVPGARAPALIARLGALFFELSPLAALLVAATGAAGMVVDSLLGATMEGTRLTNQSVNLLATLSAGLLAAAGSLVL